MGSERVAMWWEYYGCGCVSEFVAHKKDLRGYCGTHGNQRESLHRDLVAPTPEGGPYG